MPQDSLTPEVRLEIEDTLSAYRFDILEWIEIRITDLDGSVTQQKVIEFCKTQSVTFLGGEEYANNHHFHLAIAYEKSPKLADFTQLIYDHFQCEFTPEGTRTGNSSHSKKKVKNLPSYLTYCTKDGAYFSSGIEHGFVEYLFSHSHQKASMSQQILNFSEDFQKDEISIQELAEKLIKLRAMYNCYNPTKIQEIIQSQQIIKKPSLAKDLAKKIKYL